MIKTQHCPNCEATEQKLLDFRQEVSDECAWMLEYGNAQNMLRFIIPAPKPDPLVEVLTDLDWLSATGKFRAALEARGLEIREKNDDQ